MRSKPVPPAVVRSIQNDLTETCRYWERFGYRISFLGTVRSIVNGAMTPARIGHRPELEKSLPCPCERRNLMARTVPDYHSKGEKARAAALTKVQRRVIAQKAARARWAKKTK
jgi:hypothetical protein